MRWSSCSHGCLAPMRCLCAARGGAAARDSRVRRGRRPALKQRHWLSVAAVRVHAPYGRMRGSGLATGAATVRRATGGGGAPSGRATGGGGGSGATWRHTKERLPPPALGAEGRPPGPAGGSGVLSRGNPTPKVGAWRSPPLTGVLPRPSPPPQIGSVGSTCGCPSTAVPNARCPRHPRGCGTCRAPTPPLAAAPDPARTTGAGRGMGAGGSCERAGGGAAAGCARG